MKRIAIRTLYLAATLLAIVPSANAQAISVSANFTRTGAGESLTALHSIAGGTPTVGTYGGLTEILVSGTGNANGATVADAFYNLNGTPVGGFYGMNIGYTGLPFAGGAANNIQARMDFIETVGAVAPGTIPPYRVGHDYRFVVNLPTNAGILRFGTSDGNYGDNGGAFNVQVFPVIRGAVAVPESSTLALCVLPMIALSMVMLRRREARGG